MLDILLKAVEQLFIAYQTVAEKSDKQNKRKFGKVLAECYLRLVDVITVAEKITTALERFKTEYENDKRFSSFWIDFELEEQLVNLRKLRESIRAVSKELYVLDPKAVFGLIDLVTGKASAIGVLQTALRAKSLPTHISYEKNKLEDQTSFVNSFGTASYDHLIREELLFYSHVPPKNLEVQSIDSQLGATEESYKIVKQYLQTEKPETRIKKLKSYMEKIRKIIVDNFEIEDILWAVGRVN